MLHVIVNEIEREREREREIAQSAPRIERDPLSRLYPVVPHASSGLHHGRPSGATTRAAALLASVSG